MPFYFEDGHAPGDLLSLKRKRSSISRDTSPINGEPASTAGGDLAGLVSPMRTKEAASNSPNLEDNAATHVTGASEAQIVQGDQLSHGLYPTFSRLPNQASEPDELDIASSMLLAIGTTNGSSNTETTLQVTRGSSSVELTGQSNDGIKRIVQHTDANTLYKLSQFDQILARLKSDAYPDESSPGFSRLQENVLSEKALSKEDMYEQHQISQKSKPTSPVPGSVSHKSVSAGTAEQSAIPRCRKHHIENAQPIDGEDGCDSDCFSEYDPLDDVEEVRVALKKLETTGKHIATPKDQSSQMPVKLNLSNRNEKFDTSRRPYLNHQARTQLRKIELYPDFDSLAGSLVHISFSRSEAHHVWSAAYLACLEFATGTFSIDAGISALQAFAYSEQPLGEKHEIMDSVTATAALKLPGRTPQDVANYIADVLGSKVDPLADVKKITISLRRTQKKPSSWSWSELAFARSLDDGWSLKSLPRSHAEIRSIQLQKSLEFIQPFRVFAEGSSDVVDCAWDATGENFALGCTTYSDMYNRPGNLMLGNTKGEIKFMCGHQTVRPPNQGNEAILDPYLHSTVTSVDFSHGLLYSGSYDSTIKIWDVKQRQLQRSLKFSAPIVAMKMNKKIENVGAACVQNGDFVIFRHSSDRDQSDACQKFPASNERFEGSSVLWSNAKSRTGWVFVSYDNKESDRREPTAQAGDLRLFDAVHGVEVGSIKPGSTRQFDICLDASEQLLVAGAVSGPARALTPNTFSHVRVWDLRTALRRILEFGCQHKDINKVTISPCQSYITSSGTNGKSYLWDVRYGSEPLHVLEHGDSKTPLSPERDREDADTGVTFASWATADGGLFITGSSDGLVKVWDPTRADPFLHNLAAFDDPVMSGAFSPDGTALIIGETTGKATLLSHAGRHGPPEDFVQDRSMLAPSASEVEESGVQRAQRLLQTGQVVMVYEDGGRPAVYGR
ncbi:hypothetical protein ABW21_db0205043 [Orbilia brochopaga]|nr:hypothetical protein ABW21_db0205043 [Drechslerella brochopaga]